LRHLEKLSEFYRQRAEVAVQCAEKHLTGIAHMHNKLCLNISQETHLNSVLNDSLPFMVGQSRVSFTLLNVKQGMLSLI
jgi:hypothetical protein